MRTVLNVLYSVGSFVATVLTNTFRSPSKNYSTQKALAIIPKHSRYITASVKEEVIERQRDDEGNLVCAACLKIIRNNPGHLSHLKAYSLGGDNSASNLLYCCRSCNLEVGTEHPAIYYARFGQLAKLLRILAFSVPSKVQLRELFTECGIRRRSNTKDALIAICKLRSKNLPIPKEFLLASHQ